MNKGDKVVLANYKGNMKFLNGKEGTITQIFKTGRVKVQLKNPVEMPREAGYGTLLIWVANKKNLKDLKRTPIMLKDLSKYK